MTSTTLMFEAEWLRARSARWSAPTAPLPRHRLAGAREDRLYFAQVREDPMIEIEALALGPSDRAVVVSSGGCTALSLLASGAGRVAAVDINCSQNHLLELKAAAVRTLEPGSACAFLGGSPAEAEERELGYAGLRHLLSGPASAFWDSRLDLVRKGVLNAGVSERFIAVLAAAVRLLVHPRSRIDALLRCESLSEQRDLYEREWNSARWRALFRILLNRMVFNRTYDPAFFAHARQPDFAAHFHGLLEHALRDVPVGTNYFLRHMLTGSYRPISDACLPPYLQQAVNARLRDGITGLELIDGGYSEYLAQLPDNSVDGLALSNICEWLEREQVLEFFTQVYRVAKDGTRVCFRNFVGHTEVPQPYASRIVENVAAGEIAIARDRSCVQSRVALCTVRK